ncbi:Phytochrome-like protein cph2 [uncultured bacterium]|nr:Phytochrome-like protein cph2 [uncultured bacterium]
MASTKQKRQRKDTSGEGFREVLDASSDAVITAGEDGAVQFWNRAAAKMFGYTAEEALSLKVVDLVPEEYRERHKEGFGRFIKTGKGRIMGRAAIVKARRRDGTVFPVELSLAGYKTGGGWVLAAIIRDTTVRRNFEHKLAHQSRLLSKANKELAMLAKVSTLLSQSMESSELLSNILDTITRIELFKLERCGGILILRDGSLTLAAHLGHNGDFLEKHKSIRFGECLCGLAAETGEVITSGDSSEDARHTIVYKDMRPHGHIIVPLKAKNSVVGVLYLYLQKGSPVVDSTRKSFLESIGGMLGVAVSNSLLYEETRRLSLHDPLTGLANKRLLDMELERNFMLAKRYGRPFACLMLDMDHFKEFNDSKGHLAGDKMLQAVSKTMTAALRETDFAARYGGEEFFVLLPETAAGNAALVAAKILEAIRKTGVTASIGVAAFDKRMSGPASLVEAADRALYSAKKNGRDRVEVSSAT